MSEKQAVIRKSSWILIRLNTKSQPKENASKHSLSTPVERVELIMLQRIVKSRSISSLSASPVAGRTFILLLIIPFVGHRHLYLVVKRQLQSHKHRDCNDHNHGGDHLQEQEAHLWASESVDLTPSMPGQRSVETTAQSDRRDERQDRSDCNNREEAATTCIGLRGDPRVVAVFTTPDDGIIERVRALAALDLPKRLIRRLRSGIAAVSPVPRVQARWRVKDVVPAPVRIGDPMDRNV